MAEAKAVKEIIEKLPDDAPVWFWITTKSELDERMKNNNEPILTDKEYAHVISLLDVDDQMVDTCYQGEDWALNSVLEKRKAVELTKQLIQEGK